VIFFKFRRRGTYTITNTVTDCEGQKIVCEKTVSVTRKRFHILASLGGLYEKTVGTDTEEGLFDIRLVVQTDPWPDRQFVRASIQQLSGPPGITPTNRIQLFRDGALIGEGSSAVFEQMLPGDGNYRVTARSTATFNGQSLEDNEEVAFTISGVENETFTRDDNDDEFETIVSGSDDNWYIPLKVGFAYELVSNLEAALYGGVAISVDSLEDSAVFADLELNYRNQPVMLGVGIGWWNLNHSEIDRIDFLVNAGIIFAQSLLGSETWTFLVQGRFPLNREDGVEFSDEYRIFFGIRLDF